MSALEQLATFVAAHRPDDRARAQVRLHVADTLGAWIAATGTDEGRALIKYRTTDLQLSNLVAVNCALARSSEVDDIHLAAMVTPGAIVIPAALTIAAALPNENADDLIAAIVSGYEAMIRLGIAIDGPSVLYRGIWPSYFAAPFGVTAVYARLAKLDSQQTAHALALALIMATPGVGHHTAVTTARWLAIGHAAARGLRAARAAQAGFTSDIKLADGDFMKNIYGIVLDVNTLRDGLGEMALGQVSFKPWCAARQTMAATQALNEIITEGVAVESIKAIEAAVLPVHLKMIDHGVTAGDRFSHLTSVQYQMAVATLNPDSAYRLSAPSEAISSSLKSFMACIKVRADESLLADGYPKSWPAQVTVVTASGRHERRVSHVPGDPARALSENDLRRKFCRLATPILGERLADETYSRALSALDRPPASLIRDIEKICEPFMKPRLEGIVR
jgi:2-methylcitrate dehydratase PrpD